MSGTSNDIKYTSFSEAISNCKPNPNVPITSLIPIKAFAKSTGLEAELAAKGFRSFKPIVYGSTGVVLQTTDDQVIRICQMRTHKDLSLFRAKALQEVQAIERVDNGKLVYEILPQYVMNGDPKAFQALGDNLKERGHIPKKEKLKKEDVGYTDNGRLAMLLDPDSLDNTKTYHYDPVKDKPWIVKRPGQKSVQFDLPEGIISKQEADCPALMDGRVRGVLTDQDKERLEAGEIKALRAEKPECFEGIADKNLPEFMQYVFGDGMYPQAATKLIQKTAVEKTGVPFKVDGGVHLGKLDLSRVRKIELVNTL